MKKLLLFLCCLVPALAQAQTDASALRPDSVTHLLTRAETVLVPGVSQAALYARAQAWLATAYQTTPKATSPNTGLVQGTGWREIEMVVGGGESMPLNLWYTITIAVQPGRYRYALTEFKTQREPTPTNTAPEKQAIESVIRTEQAAGTNLTNYSQQAAGAAQAIAETIAAQMADPSTSTEGESR